MGKIIQIVPRLSPSVDGVGDYALNLAREMQKSRDIETHFIVGDPEWVGPAELEGFKVDKVGSCSSKVLFKLLSDRGYRSLPILLHFVGYGYEKRGCPFWMLEALKTWKNEGSQVRLITMFHELYAFGPPWRSSFWVSPIQRSLAKEISKLSDFLFTSRNQYADILRNWNLESKKPIHIMPVFSNVGEPKEIPSLKNRQQRMIVFGKNRRQIYTGRIESLFLACKALNIEEILDIGPLTGLDLKDVRGIPLTQKGELEAVEISSLMLDSTSGFLDCPTNCLAKSTIFAAYSAHGILPVASSYQGDADGLNKNLHYLTADTISILDLTTTQLIANNAHDWYQNHTLAKYTQTITYYYNED